MDERSVRGGRKSESRTKILKQTDSFSKLQNKISDSNAANARELLD